MGGHGPTPHEPASKCEALHGLRSWLRSSVCLLTDGPLYGNLGFDLHRELALLLGHSQCLVVVTSIDLRDLGVVRRCALVIRQPLRYRRLLPRPTTCHYVLRI